MSSWKYNNHKIMQSNDNLKDKRDDIELKWNTDNQ